MYRRKRVKHRKRLSRYQRAKKVYKKEKATEFCKKCGSLMLPNKRGSSTYMRCRSCGFSVKWGAKDIKISEEKTRKKGIVVLEKDVAMLPTTDKTCPDCEHQRAYWWLQQTRASDEPPTQFFRCMKCKHTWREYK